MQQPQRHAVALQGQGTVAVKAAGRLKIADVAQPGGLLERRITERRRVMGNVDGGLALQRRGGGRLPTALQIVPRHTVVGEETIRRLGLVAIGQRLRKSVARLFRQMRQDAFEPAFQSAIRQRRGRGNLRSP